MNDNSAQETFNQIKTYYESVPSPKYRNIETADFETKFKQLIELKDAVGHDDSYPKLVNAMSQILSKITAKDRVREWFNYSERGMNKVIPAISKRMDITLPFEWTDKWGYDCFVSNGYWETKNYRVMDALGYMFILKEGGDCLPKNAKPLFEDLYDLRQRESMLNSPQTNIGKGSKHDIWFKDSDFKKFSGLKLSSTGIMALLLETSRVEFKLTFPVRLRTTEAKENIHPMNYFSRFYELGYEEVKVKGNGVILERFYHVVFNTMLGEMFVSNLLAKNNSKIDHRFYLLPDSAQIFYRRALVHNNFPNMQFALATIAEFTGLKDTNQRNLRATVESNILTPLKESGLIDSFENISDDPKYPKYCIKRSGKDTKAISEEAGSVKKEAGSVKKKAGSVNENRP